MLFLTLAVNTNLAQEGAYVNSITVKQGDTLKFYINTSSNLFTLKIMKWESETIKNTVAQFTNIQGGLRAVPPDAYMNGCNWPESFRIVVPNTWAPGFYRATFPTSAGGGGVLFFVRPSTPGTFSKILMVLAVNTWQAYNDYGGKNLYPSNSPDRSYRVSFERPSAHPFGAYLFFKYDIRFWDWGYYNNVKMEFASDYDIHANPDLLSNYSVVVIPGHNEYWSSQMRKSYQTYVNSGGKLMILGGNTCWWQIRYENNGNTIVCYKERNLDPLNGIVDSLVTVNWFAPPVNRPENTLIGVSYRNGGYVNSGNTFPDSQGYGDYAAYNTHHWVYEGTNLTEGEEFGYSNSIVGYEVDGALFSWNNGIPVVTAQDTTPSNFRILGVSPAYNSKSAFPHSTMGIYHLPNGGSVFNAATIEWGDGLISDTLVQKITLNVLNKFLLNKFPPEIIDWSPRNVTQVTINNELMYKHTRNVTIASNQSLQLSIGASNPYGPAPGYFWTVNGSLVDQDASYNFSRSVSSNTVFNVTAYAYNSIDTGSISWSVTVQAGSIQVPPPVVLLSPANNSLNISIPVTLTWQAASGASSYRVQVSTTSSMSNLVFETFSAPGTSIEVSTLNPGTKYYWRVRGRNSAGGGVWSSTWNFTTSSAAGGIPPAVVLVSPANNSINIVLPVTLTWQAAAGATSYRVQVSTTSSMSNLVYETFSAPGTSIQVNTLTRGIKYYWRVRGRNSAGGGDWSPIWNFTTDSTTSLNIVSEIISLDALLIPEVNEIKLQWKTEEVLKNYEFIVQKKESNSNEWKDVGLIKEYRIAEGKNSFYFIDRSFSGVHELKYRLKQIIPNGEKFSDVTYVTIPKEFKLFQNYPNPFNPKTTISFLIPEDGNVKLILHNFLGEEILTIINKELQSGFHSVDLEASGLASGIYYYTLIAERGNYKESKKLILLK